MPEKGSAPNFPQLPFIPLLPITMEFDDVSIRSAFGKRQSIRYLVHFGGKTYRVKEFFMDWFYTGFPKCLMSSLVGVYTVADPSFDCGKIWFYGKDYKGRDSATFYQKGTTVEIESYEHAVLDEFKEIVCDLEIVGGVEHRFKDLGFTARSFLASGGSGPWWEEERISRMEWRDLGTGRTVVVGYDTMIPRSAGIYQKRGLYHEILVLSDDYFDHVVWLDVTNAGIAMNHAEYRFRKEPGIFDTFIGTNPTIYHKKPFGPSIIQFKGNLETVTASFSPGIQLDSVKSAAAGLEKILESAKTYMHVT